METNLYSYVGNRPTMFVDPLGLWAVGISFEFSTINPFSSGGGGSYGICARQEFMIKKSEKIG
jgi:hypothetical protein